MIIEAVRELTGTLIFTDGTAKAKKEGWIYGIRVCYIFNFSPNACSSAYLMFLRVLIVKRRR
jgi:hypothetical protein